MFVPDTSELVKGTRLKLERPMFIDGGHFTQGHEFIVENTYWGAGYQLFVLRDPEGMVVTVHSLSKYYIIKDD